jgi:hypothetical protein
MKKGQKAVVKPKEDSKVKVEIIFIFYWTCETERAKDF